MKLTLNILALVFLLSCSHKSETKNSVSAGSALSSKDPFTDEANLLQKYTLAELGSALNVMRVISDQAKRKVNREFCDLSFEEASLMAQQLRFLIEEKIEELDAAKLINRNPPEDWRRCAELCNCYVFARAYRDQHDYFNKKMKELTTPQAYQCAKGAQGAGWFCGSELHQYLKSLAVLPESNF